MAYSRSSSSMDEMIFLDAIAPQLGLTVDASTDRIINIRVGMTSCCGTERTDHILMQDQIPFALDLARRLQAIPQLRDVHVAITLERRLFCDDTPIGTSAETTVLRNCFYCLPGLGFDNWSEDGWYSYGEETANRIS